MTIATLKQVLDPALHEGYGVAGLVVLGWEDARAYVEAAELERMPVILQAGPACRAYTPLPVLAAMFRTLAESSSMPVAVHLDHSYSLDECRIAIDVGFTSVMFDGSKKSLAENIRTTAEVVKLSHRAGVSVEGEIGFVGYAAAEPSRQTDPAEAGRFESETGVDATAISIGNVHLQQNREAQINFDRLREIEAKTSGPLVIHGASGLAPQLRRTLATTTRICKFNVGTELRMVFGRSLGQILRAEPQQFDRLAILGKTIAPLREAARAIVRELGSPRP